MSGTAYRRDIDGLRAVAVLAVVVYHAFPRLLPGGFIGVDVFFVISGFLITGILVDEHRERRFSLVRFYARRVRRLLPALAVVLLACLIAGWLLLFPDELRQLGRHVLGAAAFVSNVVLLKEVGYFDTSAETKVLLHLWSLGIEEQFYIAWPVVLMVLARRTRQLLPFVGVAVLVSVLRSVMLAGTAAGFYLPVPRSWELLAGAAVAIASRDETWRARMMRVRGVAWAGGALLITGFVLVDRTRAFPGLWPAFPVVGTALLLIAGPEAAINRHVLALRGLVAIGLVSYPLYLWHWPVLVFGRLAGGRHQGPALTVGLVAASFALAAATYRYIETPVRRSRAGLRTPVLLGGAIAVLALGAGWLVWGLRHHAKPYPRCAPALASIDPPLLYCVQSNANVPTAAVIGDSHADHWFAGIAAAAPDQSWLLAGHPSCPPVSGVDVHADQAGCEERSEGILAYIAATPAITTVVLAYFAGYTQDTDYARDHVGGHNGPSTTTMTGPAPGSKSELFYLGLDRAVSGLERAGKRVVIVEDVPELPFSPRDCVARARFLSPAREPCEIARSDVDARQVGPRAIVARLAAAHPRVLVFDPLETLCSRRACLVSRDGQLVYADSHHLSEWGSTWLAHTFLPWLAEQARR